MAKRNPVKLLADADKARRVAMGRSQTRGAGTESTGKLTATLIAQLAAHLRAGLFRENACQLLGVHPDTIKVWMRLGRRDLDDADNTLAKTGEWPDLTRHAQLVVEVLAAEAAVEAAMVGVVTTIALAGTDEGAKLRAAVWYLERKRNLVYGKGALRVDLHVPEDADDGSNEDAETAAVLESLERFIARREAVTGGGETH